MSMISEDGTADAVPQWSAAPIDLAAPLHNPHPRHFSPRPLGTSERKRLDVFSFRSCKENRQVDVIGPLQLGFRLQLEFNPTVTAVTERPRSVEVGGKQIELSFWWRHNTGREHFALLIADKDTLPGPDGRRRPRQVDRLRLAARDAGIDLQLVTEDQVRGQEHRTELAFQLLPWVQSAAGLKADLVLRQEVGTAIRRYARCTVDQLLQDLAMFPVSDVLIVIAELIYLGAIDTDAKRRLMRRSLIWSTRR
ncbi:MAG: hypothetical protein DI562_00420 [Stenotrophomonas acidaminiphila]|nr:MAG: hypothetical protein DI562_00420 [Stenotrophomonas acidaminiphila]